MTSKRGRWVTLIVWVVLTAMLSMTLPNVNSVEDNSSQLLDDQVMSVKAQKIIKEEFPNENGMPLLIVWERSGGLEKDDYHTIQQLYVELTKHPLKEMGDLPPFSKLPIQALAKGTSKDGEAIITPIFIHNGADQDVLKADVQAVKDKIKQLTNKETVEGDVSTPGLHVRLTGPVGISVDAVSLFSKADLTLLFSTVLLVLILLIVLYRSPILAIVPLIAVAFAYGLAGPILGAMAKNGWITVDAQAVSIMTVLLFGAGTDYCLFLVSKYRENLLYEENKITALQKALKHSGGAIAMSALTVVLGLFTLLLARYGSYIHFAVPFSLAVLIMGLTALTFLPAVLSLLGRSAFWPFIPRTKEMTQKLSEAKKRPIKQRKAHGAFSQHLGEWVTNRPWQILVGSVVILGILALMTPNIKYTYGLLDSFPKDMPSRVGYSMIEKHFASGDLAPVQVIVDTEGKTLSVSERLKDLPFIESVSEAQSGTHHKNLVRYDVVLNQNPYSTEMVNAIPEIKDQVRLALKDAGITTKDHYWIGGETSELYDTEQITQRDQTVIMPTVIAIIALLLLLYLRSIIAMVYLILSVLLSYFAALGLGWVILHHLMGANALQGLIPLYAFVFLVALGEDYNIFMMSSIWKHRKTHSIKESIRKGVTETSSVITSCGLILAATFAVLATMPMEVLLQFGIVTAIGVLLDTFIVRPLLVPSITAILGRWAFWPGKWWKTDATIAESKGSFETDQ